MPDPTLFLTASGYQNERQWFWRLTDAGGAFLADHHVSLDATDWQCAACLDLYEYLHGQAAPDRRREDELRLLNDVGAWLGVQVLGRVADKIIERASPGTVRVVIPPDPAGAARLLYLPLELAHAGGRPLALQHVSLVFEVQGEETRAARQPVGDRLRMLAVFSLPTDANALNLRHERHQLKQLIEGIARQRGLGIELRVLQYGVTRERHRDLVVQTLRLVQGHPELLKLAEGQAAEPEALAKHLERATTAWTSRLEAFFQERRSALGEDDFLRTLGQWSSAIAATLPEPTRVLFHFLCCLEEEDRLDWVVKDSWGDLWKRLERPGEPPDLATHLALLRSVGLVDVRSIRGTGEGSSEERATYRVHPGVAEAGRKEAGEPFQAAVDHELAAFWRAVFDHGLKTEMQGGGRWVVRAGQSAAPYLLRQQQWEAASSMLEQVVHRDKSPATMATVLPMLRRIAIGTKLYFARFPHTRTPKTAEKMRGPSNNGPFGGFGKPAQKAANP